MGLVEPDEAVPSPRHSMVAFVYLTGVPVGRLGPWGHHQLGLGSCVWLSAVAPRPALWCLYLCACAVEVRVRVRVRLHRFFQAAGLCS